MKEREVYEKLRALNLVTDEQVQKAEKLRKSVGKRARLVDILIKLGYVLI